MMVHRLCEAVMAPCAECDSRLLQRRGQGEGIWDAAPDISCGSGLGGAVRH